MGSNGSHVSELQEVIYSCHRLVLTLLKLADDSMKKTTKNKNISVDTSVENVADKSSVI